MIQPDRVTEPNAQISRPAFLEGSHKISKSAAIADSRGVDGAMPQKVLQVQSFGTLPATGSDGFALMRRDCMLLSTNGVVSGSLPSAVLFSLLLRRRLRAASHF